LADDFRCWACKPNRCVCEQDDQEDPRIARAEMDHDEYYPNKEE
jgi:hypothetical protein